ncbi:hypothetical protein N9368_01030 [Alphaproteobacteria bacterium]|nr:hypothetical protein [Alphaproteobacteria bacterium]
MFRNFKSAKYSDELYQLQKLCHVSLLYVHPMVGCICYEGGIKYDLRVIDVKIIKKYLKLHNRIVQVALHDHPSTIGEVKLLTHKFFKYLIDNEAEDLGNVILFYLKERGSDDAFRKLYETSYGGHDLDDWLALTSDDLMWNDFDTNFLHFINKWAT